MEKLPSTAIFFPSISLSLSSFSFHQIKLNVLLKKIKQQQQQKTTTKM